jgi:hypothetical protein
MIQGKRVIKGKRGKYHGTNAQYKPQDWVMVHTNGDGQRVGLVLTTNMLAATVRFYMNEVWTEIESGLEHVEVQHADLSVPITSIACKIPQDVAKNLLLLQGVEL